MSLETVNMFFQVKLKKLFFINWVIIFIVNSDCRTVKYTLDTDDDDGVYCNCFMLDSDFSYT